ncbi:MAG: hypothetical protein IT372_22995 [Polyangiaceae bacterium]|nr:hypothetical protein [Polyangiaceae bacterium]
MSDEDKRRKYGPLSELARAWEAKKVKELGLEDVPWDASCLCQWCREEADSDEAPISGMTLALPVWLQEPPRGLVGSYANYPASRVLRRRRSLRRGR